MPKPYAQMRLAELTSIRRSLSDEEVAETIRLKRTPYYADYKRARYANDPAFRAEQKARSAAYKARQRERQP